MIKYIYISVTILLLLVSSCNSGNNDTNIQEQTNAATSLAHRQAIEIIFLYENDKDIMTKIIDVKEMEYKLRNIGNDSIANVYIHAFEKYIREYSPSLSEEIFK